MDRTNGMTLEPEAAPAWRAWLETGALAAALIAGGALLDRRDPFLLHRAFSWLALAPLLAGLRYGSIAGMACAAVQALALAITKEWGGISAPPGPPEIVLGWLAVGLVAGESRDAWLRRRRQLQALAHSVRLRHEGLARAYHALKASHDRLQRGTAGRPSSLRDALDALRRDLAEHLDGESLGAVGGRILALFSAHAFVRAATLHAVDGDGRPGPAIASLAGGRGAEEDPLVRRAARLGEVVSVRDVGEGSLVLAAVPLVDVEDRVHAVVAIRDMPFVAFHADALDLLAVLGGHLGDLVSQALAPAAGAGRFLRSLSRATADARRHGVPFSVALVRVSAAPGQPFDGRLLASRIAAERRRSDDAVVLSDAGGRPSVAILLRLSDAQGLAGYRARLERFVRGQPGAGAEISFRGWSLADSFPSGWPDRLRAALAEAGAMPEASERRETEEASWRPGAA